MGPTGPSGYPFTVFGQVLGNGMQIIDQINALKTLNEQLGVTVTATNNPFPLLGETPLLSSFNPNTSTQINASDFVAVNSITHPSISGNVFADATSSGTPTGNVGLGGWTVYLDNSSATNHTDNGVLDSDERSVQTDANGNYTFNDLPAGNYIVRIVPQANWTRDIPTAAKTGRYA